MGAVVNVHVVFGTEVSSMCGLVLVAETYTFQS